MPPRKTKATVTAPAEAALEVEAAPAERAELPDKDLADAVEDFEGEL